MRTKNTRFGKWIYRAYEESGVMILHSLLISILRDHIHSVQTSPFTANWADLLTLAKRHEVTGIVYTQCKSFTPQPFVDDLNRSFTSVVYYYVNRKKMADRIEAALIDIEHFSIKGASIAQFYPFPAYRTMGDTDVVVHRADREDTDRRLQGLGLKNVSSQEDREWQYYYKDMEFELHDRLVYSEAVNVDIQEQFFNDFWKYVHGNKLDWNFHFLFLIFHLRKHFMNSGIGFRHFLDIAVITFRGPQLDWEWIMTELKKLGLWGFAERVFALNEYWFDVPSPLSISVRPSFFSSATELISKNGIFGFDNKENQGNTIVNAVRGDGNVKFKMLYRALQGLFPGYEILKRVPHYSYVARRPYLVPVVWVHRAIRSILNKCVVKNLKAVVNESFTNQETIKKREAIYEQWGL